MKNKFENLSKALKSLEGALATPPVEERDYAGIIKSFEFVYELTWKILKAILEKNGIEAPFPRIVFEKSFAAGLLEGNEVWKAMIEDRNLSTHTYDMQLSRDLCARIQKNYFSVLQKTYRKIEAQVNQ